MDVVRLAYEHYERGDCAKAIDILSNYVMKNPNCKSCRYHMGHIVNECDKMSMHKSVKTVNERQGTR